MKDSIVAEIHRYRAEHARRFNYDIRAMGEDIRRREAESGGKLVGWDAKRKRLVEVKKSRTPARKRIAVAK